MRLAADIPRRLIVAVGGNAIDADRGDDSPEEQKAIAARTAQAMLPLLQLDNQLVITHGNGPQVGKLLLANAIARERVAPLSLDILVAQTQGATAYILAQAFENALREVGNPRHVVGLVTQVEVDPDDPAFANPTKPVGPFFTEAEAKALADELGVTVQGGRRPRLALRRSPRPSRSTSATSRWSQALMALRTVVIAGGGGGIPVVRDAQGCRHGVEAVIDKDLTTAAMANVLGIRDMMILTAVPRVAIHFGKPEQRELRRGVAVADPALPGRGALSRPAAWGRRSMRRSASSKAAASARSSPASRPAMPALRGETGTHIVSDADFAALHANRRRDRRVRDDVDTRPAVAGRRAVHDIRCAGANGDDGSYSVPVRRRGRERN